MKKRFGSIHHPGVMMLSLAVGLLLAVAGQAAASDTNTESPRVVLTLVDGSHLMGQLDTNILSFQGPITGAQSYPLARVRSIDWPGDPDRAMVTTVTRDTFHGVLSGKTITLKTGYSELHISTVQIRLMQIEQSDRSGLMDSLVAYWSADAGAKDSAGNRDGELLFNAGFAPGKVGKAYRFDGIRSRVSVRDQERFILTNSLTIAAWLNVTALPPANGTGLVFFRGDTHPGLDPYSVSIQPDGRIGFSIVSADNQSASLFAPIETGRWFHFAGVLDGASGRMQLYIDGENRAQRATPIRPIGALDPAAEPAIGIGNHGARARNFPFAGLIDELGLYSRALTQTEIKAIIKTGAAGEPLFMGR